MTENSVDVNRDDNGTVTVDLYDANKGKAPRTGGPYLDEVDAEQAEIRRAKIEKREPDLDNPPATVGTRLVPKSQLVERDVDKSHYSDAVEIENEPVASYEADTTSGFEGEPDPLQPNFDNNMQRVTLAEAGLKEQELKEQAEASKKTEPETPLYNEDDNV